MSERNNRQGWFGSAAHPRLLASARGLSIEVSRAGMGGAPINCVFTQPLLTDFEAEALYYLALGLSNWAIARKCHLSLRGVESRLTTLYEKLLITDAEGTPDEAYDKLAFNIRTRAYFEALRRGLINQDELEKAGADLEKWLERDRKKFAAEQSGKA